MTSLEINLPVIREKTNGCSNGTDKNHSRKEKDHECTCSSSDTPDYKYEIIEVLFKGNRRGFFLNKHNFQIQPDDKVVVLCENGTDLGLVTYTGASAKARLRSCTKTKITENEVIRIATDQDLEIYYGNTAEEPSVVRRSRDLINHFNLDIKITEAEWQLDRQRLTIFFTAPQRVDFRELVKELARTFRTRIELRQISSREETKRIGDGFGACGLNLCCTSFLTDFNHITLEHARLQQLSTNVNKLSGYCGRLKCCLLYEYDTYSEAFKDYPQLHSRIQTEDGMAKLIKVDIFKNVSTLFYPDKGKYKSLEYSELEMYMKNGKILPPSREDLEHYYHQYGVQTKRDMHGEEYIVE